MMYVSKIIMLYTLNIQYQISVTPQPTVPSVCFTSTHSTKCLLHLSTQFWVSVIPQHITLTVCYTSTYCTECLLHLNNSGGENRKEVLGGCGESGPLCPVAGAGKTVRRFLKKLQKKELPCNVRILLQDIYSQNLDTESQRDICRSMFMTTLLTTAEMREKPECPPTDAQTNKTWHVHIMQHYSAMQREETRTYGTT